MSSEASDGATAGANRESSPAIGDLNLDETIHQPTRLRIMTLLVSVPESDRLAYGFIQQTLGLTGGNQTVHLRKLGAAGFLTITKEFDGAKPRTWLQATATGRRAYAHYLSNLQRTLGLGMRAADGQAGSQ